MSKIRILPEQLANQIAAGEVVERPASVVKELLENSLDAGASHIEIEIEGGGTRTIRITDDGEGMDEDDVLLCFERHGTSKIKEVDDLVSVNTLGFRGEAIPSIASVSRMTITSRPRHLELGTTIVSHFGSIKKVHETGASTGTSIEIKNLFGNTPARRKFLRTTRTELSHIDDIVKNYALARPDVGITLRINDRETIRLEPGMELKTRLAQLLNYRGEFLTVDSGAAGPDSIVVSGLLLPPESSAPVAGRIRLFVNNRAIKDRLLVHAVNEGLRSFLLKGRSPAGIIKVTLSPDLVDVNVHPAKHEVRFRNSHLVHQKVSDCVREAMISQQQRVRQDIFISSPSYRQPGDEMLNLPGNKFRPDHSPGLSSFGASESEKKGARHPASLPHLFATREETPYPSPDKSYGYTPSGVSDLQGEAIQVEELVVIGSFLDLYIFCRNKENLVVIDQHAAHERLLFEDLRKQYSKGRIASQNLLFPVTLELTTFQAELVEENQQSLESMGFNVRDFGGTTWVLAAVPALAGSISPQDLFLDIIEQFGSEKEYRAGGSLDTVLATMACKAAVKSGDPLSGPEIKALLERMARADLFSHCPHGRPVVKIFAHHEIIKWFHRT